MFKERLDNDPLIQSFAKELLKLKIKENPKLKQQLTSVNYGETTANILREKIDSDPKYRQMLTEVLKDSKDPKVLNLLAKQPIENHPDYYNYIRKDKIPCWGCRLD